VPVGSQLDKINSIAGLVKNYDRKDNRQNETGFIAQELFEVAPEYVSKPDKDTEMWAVNYSKMVAPLYTAMAELINEVTTLKSILKEHGFARNW